MEDAVLAQLRKLRSRYDEITDEMSHPDVAADYERSAELARERSDLQRIVELYDEYMQLQETVQSARSLLGDGDDEMREMAKAEIAESETRLEQVEHEMRVALLPSDPRDEKNVIIEIRAGAGGEEAALFAADLYRMYTRYAERKRWKTEVLNVSESDKGGFKEIVFEVRGERPFAHLKYESGVHRVQRVPDTETQGRIHTSTATVAALPEAEEVDVEIADKDIRVDIFHSSGAGGQNVNKVATAVRLTHLPTGLVVVCQDERSQHKNRVQAMTVLRSKLFDMEQEKHDREIIESRRLQVGSGDRSEKIRTYNYPQDRITDHRIGLTVHGIPDRLDGNIDELINAVASVDEAERLQAVV